MTAIEIRRDDLRTTRVLDEPVPEGDVVLEVERFGLSANNVTYAAFGDAMNYWQFFPASEEGWGRVPVWGFADVVSSQVDGVEAGERYYGYFPMANHLAVTPQLGGGGFVDVVEHRRALPAVYNQYVRTAPDATHLDETLLLRPLFGTSFLLEAFLRDKAYFDASAIVLASASSKTAYGLAFLLARAGDVPAVGLTSEGNRAFVESLGVYERVIAYDDIADALGAGDEALAFVDMAGDAAVRSAVHRAVGDRLKQSTVVGATHWEQLAPGDGDAGPLPGPAPEFFFAPTYYERLTADLGPAELAAQLGSAWDDLLEQLGDWLEVEHGSGPEDVERVWLQFVDGAVDPRRGHVLRLPG